jgi:quercetin dioxygenase-like cupin family protein
MIDTKPTAPVHVVRAADAQVLASDPTSVITLLADAGDTGGHLTSNRTRFEAGSKGAPPHFHTLGAELFFVLDGVFQMLLGDDVEVFGPGDLIVVPPRLPHAFGPGPGSSADVLIVCAPGRERFEYYRLLDRLSRGEATGQEMIDSQDRYDNHYVESSAWSAAR